MRADAPVVEDPNRLGFLFSELLDESRMQEDEHEPLLVSIGETRWLRQWRGHEVAGRMITESGDVPRDVSVTVALGTLGDPVSSSEAMAMTAMVAAAAARLPASAFYYPDEYLPYARVAYSPTSVLEYLRRTELPAAKRAPVTRERPPGRNEPCHCGSGAKYKRCHGAA